MSLDSPTIVAIGGGGCGLEPENRALDEYLIGLTGKERPRVCFIPTASGDNDAYIARFFGAFGPDRWTANYLPLFHRTTRDLRALLLGQDVVYVGGGNTAAMLAIWRQHGVDVILREAWQQGVLLCGVSAGGNCWFEACSTDSFGLDLDALNDGLGFLPGSFCPHYDGEERRRPTLRDFITGDRLPAGWAADNHVALRFEGTELVEAVGSKPSAKGYRVARATDGSFHEEVLETRLIV
jgi:dipeptidase E